MPTLEYEIRVLNGEIKILRDELKAKDEQIRVLSVSAPNYGYYPATLNPVTAIPADLKPGDLLGFKIIAVIGYSGDWAAYRGLTSWTDQDVSERGDKLSAEEAQPLFYAPVAAGLKYRR